MHKFKNLKRAASFAMRSEKPAFVFYGPEGEFFVAISKAAKELMSDGHEPLSLSETAIAAS